MKINFQFKRMLAFLTIGIFTPYLGIAQSNATNSSYFSNPLFITLLIVIVILLALIAVVGNVLKNIGYSDILLQLMKEDKDSSETKNNPSKSMGLLILFFLLADRLSAQNNVPADGRVGGIDPLTFYTMLAVIVAEIAVLFTLVGIIKRLLKPTLAEEVVIKKEISIEPQKSIMDKLNASIEIERESEIMMDHDYDGIKELDNNLPPWWKYGFYLTVVFALIYLLHYHVMRTGDLQDAEYKKEVALGEAAVAEYLKNSANNVDESSVVYLNQPADLEAGKQAFVSLCATCHGKMAEGGIGPNLTDSYWIHKGGIVNIFKSVKYGWPEKGMKAWKEDLSPIQMAQVSSYILSLIGTNPPNAKKAEGELYSETKMITSPDSSTTRKDTLSNKNLDSLKAN